MYLDHVPRYVNIKELLGGSLHTNSGAEQLVILNTRNPLETFGLPPTRPTPPTLPPSSSYPLCVLPSPLSSSYLPPPSPLRYSFPLPPFTIPSFLTSWIMLDKLTIQSNPKGYTATVSQRINLSILWKSIEESTIKFIRISHRSRFRSRKTWACCSSLKRTTIDDASRLSILLQ